MLGDVEKLLILGVDMLGIIIFALNKVVMFVGGYKDLDKSNGYGIIINVSDRHHGVGHWFPMGEVGIGIC